MISAAYTECNGCNRIFTHSGYTHHIQTTQRIRCHIVHATSQTMPTSQDFGHIAAPLNSNACDDIGGMAMSIDDTNSLPQLQLDEFAAPYDVACNDGKILSTYNILFTKLCAPDDEPCDDFSTAVLEDAADAADYYADADAFEAFAQPTNHSVAAIFKQVPLTMEPEMPPEPETQIDVAVQPEVADPESQPSLIIDRFPFGNPGIPINSHNNSSVGEPSQVDPHGALWAPFCFELDWRFAQWAKAQGPLSSALNDLLSLPEVRMPPSIW